MIAEPARRETLSASLAGSGARGSYGPTPGAGAFGGAIGYTGGGWLHDLQKKCNYPELPGFTRHNRADYADSTLPPVS